MAVPALAQLRRPDHKIAAMQQIAAVVIAIILGYTVAGDFGLLNALVVLAILGLVVALHPALRVLSAPGAQASRYLA